MQDIEAVGARQGEHGKFNLFELYGNYVLHKHSETYVFREWHTFRQGADLLEPNEVTEHLVDWLKQNYDAVSFEPGHSVRDDNKGLMSNPVYHERLTPAQLVQAVQGEYQVSVRVGEDSGFLSAIDLIALYRDRKSGREWCDFERWGDELVEINQQQAWLSWQHAAYLCESTTEKERIRKKMDVLGIVVPAVAIVIVSYNARRLMQECIESIRRHCGVDEYSIIVVDNASTDGVCEYLKEQSDIRVQMNDENTGFPVACNQGIALAPEGEDIFFLNNDTRMTYNALYWLRMGLYSSHDTGASGGVSNYAGIGQRLELLLATAENYEAYGRIKNVQLPAPYEEAKILCGFAMLVRRECIDRYGGMDEAFSPGYYEDTDLSLRLRQKGYRLKICRNSFIYHAGGLNFKKRPDLDEINDRNLLYLAQKWGTDFMD
ncbi:MAG: glycosyltransferase family 2 protein [Lachnospiraceae bacterium]|nr:glycosyltransferase family 2 protein [Lachnospiraceae bacterium]